MGTKMFNGLPSELKNVKNFDVFKKKLKNWFFFVMFFILFKNFT
jgi:hypothetical protein